MSWTFIHRDITSDLTLNDGQFYHSLLGETGTQAAISSGNIEAQTTFQGFAFTPEGIPGTAGATGDYTIRQEIIDGDADILVSIRLYRLNAAGAVEAQSDISDTQVATAGVKTFNFTNLDLGTWTEGDRFAVEYIFFNSRTHPGERSVTFSANTLSDDVVTPFDAGAEPVDVEMDASPGLYSVAGMAATLATTILLSASPGSYAITGVNAELIYTSDTETALDASPGSYSLTGQDTGLLTDHIISAQLGTYTKIGTDAALLTQRVIEATSSNYTTTGSDASTLFDRVSNAEPGSYTITGVNTELVYSADTETVLNASPGSYVVTGSDITTLYSRIVSLDSGAYTKNGVDLTAIYNQGGNAGVSVDILDGSESVSGDIDNLRSLDVVGGILDSPEHVSANITTPLTLFVSGALVDTPELITADIEHSVLVNVLIEDGKEIILGNMEHVPPLNISAELIDSAEHILGALGEGRLIYGSVVDGKDHISGQLEKGHIRYISSSIFDSPEKMTGFVNLTEFLPVSKDTINIIIKTKFVNIVVSKKDG